jgi:hypothetical protein
MVLALRVRTALETFFRKSCEPTSRTVASRTCFRGFFPLLAFHSLSYGHRAVIGCDRLGRWYDLVCFGGCWAETESVGFWLLYGSTRKGTGLSTPVAVLLGRRPGLAVAGKCVCGSLLNRGRLVSTGC